MVGEKGQRMPMRGTFLTCCGSAVSGAMSSRRAKRVPALARDTLAMAGLTTISPRVVPIVRPTLSFGGDAEQREAPTAESCSWAAPKASRHSMLHLQATQRAALARGATPV